MEKKVEALEIESEAKGHATKTLEDDFIPEIDPLYVPVGFFNDLKSIIEKKIFYSVYITGLSGNGKTKMVEQACAQAKREYIRVNITKETDEFDLIGAYELIEGNTVWRDGPVLVALRRGALLLLDEVDLGSERLLCLQPILEGVGYFNKKRGEFIPPAPGFNVMATANTKGKGSNDGKFIGANVLNEAFLERFAITVEQDYPSEKTERVILNNMFNSLETTPGMNTAKFSANLVKWAELLRQSYKQGATDEVITTRRLVHIVKAYSIFRNRRKAIELCLNRFDEEIKTAFMDFYSKIDPDLDKKIVEPGEADVKPLPDDVSNASNDLVAKRKAAQAAAQAAGAKAASATAQSNLQNPTGLVVFADARNIASVVSKHKVAVAVSKPDPKTGDRTVTVMGQNVVVRAGDIINAKHDLLDDIVKRIVDSVNDMDNDVDTGDDD
jgi:MoxR-like ATPase